MSVQRGDLVAGRYRLGDPLGPAWRAHDEREDVEVVLVPVPDGSPDAAPWRDRKAILPIRPSAWTAVGDDGAWLVAAPVAARTLADAVGQWGALPAEQVLMIAAGAVSALSGVGPHPGMTPDRILLTDEGKVLLLPLPTSEDALFDLGAALFLAAEGRSPFEPATGDPRQPNLAALIRGLMQKDPDHAAALDRVYAELSRLGAPLEAEHGADTLMEAQVASAAAAEDTATEGTAAEAEPEVEPEVQAVDEPTHVAAVHDIPTQPMSIEEALAETSEADAVEEADVEVSTQLMSTEELLAESGDALQAADVSDGDDELTVAAPVVSADEADADDQSTQAVPTIAASEADSDDEPTQVAPAVSASEANEADSDTDDEPTQVTPTIAAGDAREADLDTDVAADSDSDDEPTQAVPTIAAGEAGSADPGTDLAAGSDDEPTQVAPTVAASEPREADSDTADEPTQAVPTIPASNVFTSVVLTPDDESTQPMAASDALATTGEEITRPVASVAASGGLPDDEATRQVPTITPAALAAPAASMDDPPTKPEPIQDVTTGIAPPPQASPFAAPPTQAAMPVQPPQPQPQYQAPPQQQFSAAPPTQAAAAFSPPPPGAPNPWLQQPQPPQQPQNPWQNPGAPGGPPGGGWGQGQQPYYPIPGGPPPKQNTGKTVGIIVGVVAAVAAVVLVVVLISKDGGSKDNINNAANSSSRTTSQPTSSLPGTNFSSGSSTSSSPSPSDTSTSDTETPSDTATPSDTETTTSDAYTPPPDLTSTPFDPSVLNEGATDKTPLTVDALVPQDFKDDRGVHYALKAGSIQNCVQSDMSANLKDILTSNSCTKEIAASFVDDSGQYLVSVKVLPLPDQHTATVIYDDLAKENAADFGIWCPQDGPGSAACDGDYRSATIKQYREQQHRYVILSVALAVNHSESSAIAPWLESAAKKAVDACGPDNWSGNQ